MADALFGGNCGEARVGGPQFQPIYHCGRKQVNIHPAYAAAIETSMAHECGHLSMRNYAGVTKLLIVGQQLLATSGIPSEKLSANHFMTGHFF